MRPWQFSIAILTGLSDRTKKGTKNGAQQKSRNEKKMNYFRAQVQQVLGISDVDELVAKFVEAEDTNFILYSRVNECAFALYLSCYFFFFFSPQVHQSTGDPEHTGKTAPYSLNVRWSARRIPPSSTHETHPPNLPPPFSKT